MARQRGRQGRRRERPHSFQRSELELPAFGARRIAIQMELEALCVELEYEKCRAKVDLWENLCFRRYQPQGKPDNRHFSPTLKREIRQVCERLELGVLATQGVSFERRDVGGEDSQAIVRAEMRNLGTWCLMLLDRLEAAFVWSEHAECGLRQDLIAHRLVLARIFRTRAVVLVVFAEKSCRRRIESGAPEAVERYRRRVPRAHRRAQLGLERAATELDRAESILRTAGRHMRTWFRLFHQRAQLAIERLLLLAIEIDFGVGTPYTDLAFRNEVIRLANAGLVAVRGIVDCGTGTDLKRKKKGAVPWIQVMVAAYVLLASSASQPPTGVDGELDRESGQSIATFFRMNSLISQDEFVRMWQFLNKAVGLEDIVSEKADWLGQVALRSSGGDNGATNLAVMERVLAYVSSVDHRFLGGVGVEPAWFLREFILQKTTEVLECNAIDNG